MGDKKYTLSEIQLALIDNEFNAFYKEKNGTLKNFVTEEVIDVIKGFWLTPDYNRSIKEFYLGKDVRIIPNSQILNYIDSEAETDSEIVSTLKTYRELKKSNSQFLRHITGNHLEEDEFAYSDVIELIKNLQDNLDNDYDSINVNDEDTYVFGSLRFYKANNDVYVLRDANKNIEDILNGNMIDAINYNAIQKDYRSSLASYLGCNKDSVQRILPSRLLNSIDEDYKTDSEMVKVLQTCKGLTRTSSDFAKTINGNDFASDQFTINDLMELVNSIKSLDKKLESMQEKDCM